MTLAVNKGTVITYDQKALRRWQSRHRRATPTPQSQNATLARLAQTFPGKVHTH
jgi:hypothetical protein